MQLVLYVAQPWRLAALTVIVCAGLAARTTASLVEASALGPATHAPSRAAAPAPPPVARRRAATGDALVTRNMFCSSCEPAGPDAAAPFALAPAVLIETSIGVEPRATVRVIGSEVQGSWGLGDAIPGLGMLDRIAPQWIELVDAAGRRGRLRLLEAAGDGGGPARPAPPSPADPFAQRIHRIDDHAYEVDRDLVRELVTGSLKPGAMRFVPILDHGDVKGVKLYGVAPGTVGHALGLASGDTLNAVDGAPLTNVQQLLDLYARLDQLTSVGLSGSRAGKPLVLDLHLR